MPWCLLRGAAQDTTSGINGDDRRTVRQGLCRRDPGAGTDIEHEQPLQRTERVVNALRVGGTSCVVLLGYGIERHHGMILTGPSAAEPAFGAA